MAKTNAEKQREFRKRQHELGFVHLQIWIKKKHKKAIIAIAAKLEKEGG